MRQARQQRAELGQRGAVAINIAIRLLKHQTGGQRQRLVARIAVGQEGRQNQHALGVNGARQFDLALDVDHLALTQAAGGRDARGLRKHELTQADDRQRIDLPHHLALRVNQQGAALNGFKQLAVQPVAAVHLGLNGLLHVYRRYRQAAGLARPVVGLLQQVGQAAHVGGQALGVASQAGAVLNNARHGGRVQR